MWMLKDSSRLPTEVELDVIEQLQTDLTTHFNDQAHECLLKRLWYALNPPRDVTTKDGVTISARPYKRHSSNWLSLGFQCEDPAIDFRGGGKLALQAIVYFAEFYRSEALLTLSRNRYSWAIAGVNLTVLLMQILQIIPQPGKTAKEGSYKKTKYWALFHSKAGFFEFFVSGFMTMDSLWMKRIHATEMQFNVILYDTGKKLKGMLSPNPMQNNNMISLDTIIENTSNSVVALWLRNEVEHPHVTLGILNVPWTIKHVECHEEIIKHSSLKWNTMQERVSWESETSRCSVDSIPPQTETPPQSPRESQSNQSMDDNGGKYLSISMKKKLSKLVERSKSKWSHLDTSKLRSHINFPWNQKQHSKSQSNRSLLDLDDSNQLDL